MLFCAVYISVYLSKMVLRSWQLKFSCIWVFRNTVRSLRSLKQFLLSHRLGITTIFIQFPFYVAEITQESHKIWWENSLLIICWLVRGEQRWLPSSNPLQLFDLLQLLLLLQLQLSVWFEHVFIVVIANAIICIGRGCRAPIPPYPWAMHRYVY